MTKQKKMRHHRNLMERRQKLRRDSLEDGCTRKGDVKFRTAPAPDHCRLQRRRKREQADERSTVRHDRTYRIRHKNMKNDDTTAYRDTALCDVERYHHLRLEKILGLQDEVNNITIKWMKFEQSHSISGKWNCPGNLSSTNPKGSILQYYSRSDSGHAMHRRLIKLCRNEVWGDAGLDVHHDVAITTDRFRCGCGSDMKKQRFFLVCETCGYQIADVDDGDRNFKEMDIIQPPPPSYKRNNHLHEWLIRVQAVERKIVPPEVKLHVRGCFTKWGFDVKTPTYKLVRGFLKDAGYQRYFEHIPQIMNWMSGKPAMVLGEENVKKIKHVFACIQLPFEKHKPHKRKNFLSYAYVLYKVCELLELDECLSAFPLLKSRSNLMKADAVWKLICSECDYQFIPTT